METAPSTRHCFVGRRGLEAHPLRTNRPEREQVGGDAGGNWRNSDRRTPCKWDPVTNQAHARSGDCHLSCPDIAGGVLAATIICLAGFWSLPSDPRGPARCPCFHRSHGVAPRLNGSTFLWHFDCPRLAAEGRYPPETSVLRRASPNFPLCPAEHTPEGRLLPARATVRKSDDPSDLRLPQASPPCQQRRPGHCREQTRRKRSGRGSSEAPVNVRR